MRKIALAAVAVLVVGVGVAYAASEPHGPFSFVVDQTVTLSNGDTARLSGTLTVDVTAQVPDPLPPPPPPPPTPNNLVVDGNWTCSGPVNYDLVQVTNHGSGDAVRLASGCTGRIGRLEVTGVRNGDGIKVQNSGNVAHDLTVESGYVSCAGPSTDGTHQDGIQAMGGTNITFRHFVFDCYGPGGGNYFVQRAGGGATTPTNIVCDGCALGPRHPNNINLGNSVNSGVRNSLLCQPSSGRAAFQTDSGAQSIVNDNNTVVPSSDARCATLDSLIAAV